MDAFLYYMYAYCEKYPEVMKYGTIGVYRYEAQNDTLLSGGKSSISVTSGYYYSARGVHSVSKDGVKETTDTCTGALKAS